MATQTAPHTEARSVLDGEMIRETATGWGPVLSGASVAFLTFITLSSLWMAIASSGADWMAVNLEWFELGTALVAAPVGGLVTGWLGSGRAGDARGLAPWGLLLVVGLILGVPVTGALFAGAADQAVQMLAGAGEGGAGLQSVSSNLWAVFLIFGGVLAAIAGRAASGTNN